MIDTEILETIDHRTLVKWSCDCAFRVLSVFEAEEPGDTRPRIAIDAARAWVECPCAEHGVSAGDAANSANGAVSLADPEPHDLAAVAAREAADAAKHVATSPFDAGAWEVVENATDAAAAARDAVGNRSSEEAWQARRLAELLWPELSEAELEVAGSLFPVWESGVDELRTAVTAERPFASDARPEASTNDEALYDTGPVVLWQAGEGYEETTVVQGTVREVQNYSVDTWLEYLALEPGDVCGLVHPAGLDAELLGLHNLVAAVKAAEARLLPSSSPLLASQL